MPTVTCMFRGPQPEAKCSVCAQARHACTHNAFMWRCVFELWRKGGLTGASRPRREACLPAPPGYRPVCSPQTSRLPLPRPRGAALFTNPTPKRTGNDPRHPTLKEKKGLRKTGAAKGNICEQSWQPWLRRSLLVSGAGQTVDRWSLRWGRLRKSDPVLHREKRNWRLSRTSPSFLEMEIRPMCGW